MCYSFSESSSYYHFQYIPLVWRAASTKTDSGATLKKGTPSLADTAGLIATPCHALVCSSVELYVNCMKRNPPDICIGVPDASTYDGDLSLA